MYLNMNQHNPTLPEAIRSALSFYEFLEKPENVWARQNSPAADKLMRDMHSDLIEEIRKALDGRLTNKISLARIHSP
jgi:hypothetical protein